MLKASLAAAFVVALCVPASAAGAASPAKVGKEDVAGAIFHRPNTAVTEENGHKIFDNITLMTKDRKFETGMYRAGPGHYEYKAPGAYGVDEFMYFLQGSVTLTSADGTVQVIHAGEAVTIPQDWRGTWDTKGYTKFYAIYSAKGNVD